ncbi:MAG: O-antigen ligase family protein [Gracilibacteraceae bacterium]|nr:O-antigen ligase family protein [Gracilibacteraceae bacterium]
MSKKSVKNKPPEPPPKAGLSARTQALLCLGAGVLFFFAVALIGAFDSAVEKAMAIAACLVLLFICLMSVTEKFGRFLSPTALSLTLYVLIGGVSTLYAVAGKFAVSEFAKLFVAFVLYTLVLRFFTPGTPNVRRLCTVLAAVAAVFSLISIDAASAGFCTKIFRYVLGLVTPAYANAGSVLAGARISSIFNTPNIFGGVAGLGLLLSVYLTATAAARREKYLQTVFLAVTALAFLFTFSMGATLCLAVAAIVMLITAAPAERARFFVLMLETLFIGLIVMYFSFDFLGSAGLTAWIPILGCVINCAALIVLDRFIGEPLSVFLSENSRAALAAGGAIVAVLLITAFLAASLSGPAQLAAGETLRRAAYPAPGEHTLSVTASTPLNVTVEAQNMEEVMMHKQTTLYAGPAEDGVRFTVPENSSVVWFDFQAAADTELTAAGYEGHALKLRYTLLPASIANRMQGLLANQNAIQRFVFFYDGMKLFARSPLIGLGLGGFENAIFSVQNFYYTTKYAHNHYVQILAELGLLGFAPYAVFLLCAVRALWRSLRAGGRTAFAAMLAACFVMIVTHSAVEVVMSAGAFLPYAFILFALITLHCDLPAALPAPESKPARRSARKPALVVVSPYSRLMRWALGVFACVFLVLLLGNLAGRTIMASAQDKQYNEQNQTKFFSDMTLASRLDVFEKNDYLLSFVTNAPPTQNSQLIEQANKYAERLARAKSNTIQGRLTEYYFMVGDPRKAFEMSRQILDYRKADPAVWSQQFTLIAGYYRSMVEGGVMSPEDYIASVRGIYDLLLTANETRMESIALTEENLNFLRELGVITP